MAQDTAPATARPDPILARIAEYVAQDDVGSHEAYDTARLCLLDSLGCAILALRYPQCTKLLGPVVPGADLAGGARVPGTAWELDPVQAAFNIGAMIRWLDYNDTFLAAEWGHPSDNLGGILAVADSLDRGAQEPALRIRDVLTAMIKAYEIQGILALENAFNRRGLDHVILVRVATAAVATHLLKKTGQVRFSPPRERAVSLVADAVSQAWIDGGPLRTYRHAPNTGSRKSWAAGDATSRGVRLALLTLAGEMGYPTALSAPTWGFQDALFGGRAVTLGRPLGDFVMRNILFKVSYPAEFHAQTAEECAVQLHPHVKDRFEDIQRIEIHTQEPAMRIINKTGPLHNPADRDHCLQYMAAVPLLQGTLTADDYEDRAALDPRIDALRSRMQVVEDPRYSADYLDPEKRSIANAIQVFFRDGTRSDRIEVEYPIGHRRRRAEAVPLLYEKFRRNLASHLPEPQCRRIHEACDDPARLDVMRVHDFMDLFTTPAAPGP